jgi:chemotaxis response regulator CheB
VTVRALVVDDSAMMRAMVAHVLSRDARIEVVGTADGSVAARAMIQRLDPDDVTLDVEMPGMNGLEFLDKIMRLRPMSVVMLSTLTARRGYQHPRARAAVHVGRQGRRGRGPRAAARARYRGWWRRHEGAARRSGGWSDPEPSGFLMARGM